MITPTLFSSRLKARPMTPTGKLDHLAGHHAGQAVDAGDAVADFQDRADFADVDLVLVLFDFALNDRSDFVRIEFHGIR